MFRYEIASVFVFGAIPNLGTWPIFRNLATTPRIRPCRQVSRLLSRPFFIGVALAVAGILAID